MDNDSIIVIGAGSYGTALAILLAKYDYEVTLWGHNRSQMYKLKLTRCNKIYLPNIKFPDSLKIETSLSVALQNCCNIIIAVPSNSFNDILKEIKIYLHFNARVIWVTKGLEYKTGKLLEKVAKDILGNKIPLAIISGPTFAYELAINLPANIVIATDNEHFGIYLKSLFKRIKNLFICINNDFIGVQIISVAKNIIAIGVGMSDSMNFGANIRTALITYGLAEISYLGLAVGAKSYTFLGIAGLGDLILTCTDDRSRNRRFGKFIGQGVSIKQARKNIGQVIEGYDNAREMCLLANKYKVNIPIIKQIYKVLYKNQSFKTIISIIQKICQNKLYNT